MKQPSLLDALEPIDPTTQVDRIPGVDAPCICHPDRPSPCGWPFCEWRNQPEEEA